MAKARDYRAEERRRNELARERGFTTRASQRTAVRKGLVSGKPLGPKQAPYNAAGFQSVKEYRAARKAAKAWSTKHSQKVVSEYRPGTKHKDARTFRAYYDAYVNRSTAVGSSETDDGKRLAALRRYLRDFEDYTKADVHDGPYGDGNRA